MIPVRNNQVLGLTAFAESLRSKGIAVLLFTGLDVLVLRLSSSKSQ